MRAQFRRFEHADRTALTANTGLSGPGFEWFFTNQEFTRSTPALERSFDG
jgi:hypothetical protein